MKKHYVYALIDPRSSNKWKDYKKAKSVFYIGKGKWNISSGDFERYLAHIKEARNNKKSYKCNVIRKIWKEDLEISFKILSRWNTSKEAFKEEERVIAEIGLENLTNLTSGGNGGAAYGHPVTKETREKLSRAHKGRKRSKEVIEKMRLRKLGRKPSEETKKRMTEAHKRRWAEMSIKEKKEISKKIGVAHKGRIHTKESRHNMSIAHIGKSNGPKSAEHRRKISESNKRTWLLKGEKL